MQNVEIKARLVEMEAARQTGSTSGELTTWDVYGKSTRILIVGKAG